MTLYVDDPKQVNTLSYYYLRETKDEVITKYGCVDNCVYEDSENNLFCFASGQFDAQCTAPETMLSTSKQLKQDAEFLCLNQFLMNQQQLLVFGKDLLNFWPEGPCPACIKIFY